MSNEYMFRFYSILGWYYISNFRKNYKIKYNNNEFMIFTLLGFYIFNYKKKIFKKNMFKKNDSDFYPTREYINE